jgi:Mce-associated membrane protein
MKAGEEAGTLADEAAPPGVGVPDAPERDITDEPIPGDTPAEGGDLSGVPADDEAAPSDEEAEPPGDEAEPLGDEAEPAPPAGAPAWLMAMTVLVALLIAGIVTAVMNLSHVRDDNAQASSRAAALAAARIAVTDLTTADYQNPQQYAERLKPLAVGSFLNQITDSASGFEDLLTEGKVHTTGNVVDIGVQRMGPGTAQLTALVYETVKNSQTPKGSERAYRMSVSMIQSGSQWLVSNVVSVP